MTATTAAMAKNRTRTGTDPTAVATELEPHRTRTQPTEEPKSDRPQTETGNQTNQRQTTANKRTN